MNIGFDAKRLFANYTGLGNYSRTLVQNLSLYQESHQYHLYSPQILHNHKTDFFFKQANIEIHTTNSPFKSLWRSFLPVSELRKNKIDIYHGLSHELPFGIKKKEVKSVVTIHDLIFKTHPDTYRATDRAIYDFKYRYSCEKADMVLAISENTKSDIMKFYRIPEEKITVLYQSCNDIFSMPASLQSSEVLSKYKIKSQDYILYVGSVAERKNVLNLIHAYALLSKDSRPPLVIVGNGGKYLDACVALSSSLNVNHEIIWLKDLNDNHELKVIYDHSICFVYPSFYEGFGIPIIEALTCSIPVLTSNTSCLPEAGGAFAKYFDPNDPKDMFEKLKEVLDNKTLREHMIEGGLQHMKLNFDPKLLSGQLIEAYKNLLK